MDWAQSYIEKKNTIRHQQDAFRVLKKEHDLIDFCSNDYLGFARSAVLKSAIRALEAQSQFLGSTGSRLISGNSAFYEKLEQEIAAFHNAPSGLIFNSGYDANVGFFSSVPARDDTILYDALIHASIHDGIRQRRCPALSFKHNDLRDLEEKLKKTKGNKWIVVESIYSMDGDAAPLKKVVELSQKHQAALVVDEAHSNGIYGNRGEGMVSALDLEQYVFARIHTFGKAIGGHGAIILGGTQLRDFLINYARSFIYTTALPNSSLFHIKVAYNLLKETSTIHNLNQNIKLFKTCLSKNTFKKMIPSYSPIQSLVIGGNTLTKQFADNLQKQGFDIKAILHPTVAKGQERIRICIHAFNTKREIQDLCQNLNTLCN